MAKATKANKKNSKASKKSEEQIVNDLIESDETEESKTRVSSKVRKLSQLARLHARIDGMISLMSKWQDVENVVESLTHAAGHVAIAKDHVDALPDDYKPRGVRGNGASTLFPIEDGCVARITERQLKLGNYEEMADQEVTVIKGVAANKKRVLCQFTDEDGDVSRCYIVVKHLVRVVQAEA